MVKPRLNGPQSVPAGRRRRTGGAGCLATLAAIAALSAASQGALAAPAATPPGATGLPLPRFVSLKSDRVNMRNGPGTDYPTAWVYRRAGLPLEVIREFEGWRQVRDSDGATGWILQSFLSGRRTALVEPWALKAGAPAPQFPLRASADVSAAAVVKIEAGVIATVQSCDGTWCFVSVETIRGYILQKTLWGVYPNEVLK